MDMNININIIHEISIMFGHGSSITKEGRQRLLKSALSGNIKYPPIRALYWRIMLGMLSSSSNPSVWSKQLKDQVSAYKTIKEIVIPSLDKATVDPLSSFSDCNANNSNNNNSTNEWVRYYKNVDLTNVIIKDLDRLFITGIEESYFQTKERRNMLLSILLIWSYQHPVNNYRQGMHEIVGYILFCMELEVTEWDNVRKRMNNDDNVFTSSINASSSSSSTKEKDRNMIKSHDPLLHSFDRTTIEPYTFHLFTRIMDELEPLYDPTSVSVRMVDKQPFVTQFCVKIQGRE